MELLDLMGAVPGIAIIEMNIFIQRPRAHASASVVHCDVTLLGMRPGAKVLGIRSQNSQAGGPSRYEDAR